MAVRTAALLGAGGDAEDVAQEAFVKAYAALDRFRVGEPFRPWLLRIEPLLRGRPDDPTDPAEAALSRESQDALVRGLAGLSPAHRQVVTCRYLLDLDEAETAAVLGWPRGTVKSRLHRALARLRDVLESEPADATGVTHGG
ncbi:MAG: RNA polymerase sigma factor [Nocardioides sp.]|nr:RNA polymerase sigma factor [Nocardioides sp.]